MMLSSVRISNAHRQNTVNANANENLHNRLIFKLTFSKRLPLIVMVIGDNAKAMGKQ